MVAPAPAFGLVSPCGWGNLGDAAIQDSTIAHLRERHPGATFVGFTLNPADTTERHGIPAFPISGVSLPTYPVTLPAVAPTPVDRWMERLEEVRGAYRLAHAARAAWTFARGNRRHSGMVRTALADLTAIVVSGGGQLDEFWGGPWGHPYSLWRWSRLARARRIPFVVLSVGAGVLSTRWARRLVKGALSHAAYRSYRDTRSQAIADSLGLPGGAGPVVPDLAFGCPWPRPAAPGNGTRSLSVGVSPMAYRDPRVWPSADPRNGAAYAAYLGALTILIERIVGAGHRVTLFTTDPQDGRAVQDLRPRLGAVETTVVSTPTLPALQSTLAAVDVVVASRLHGVLLSHLAGRPVLALSYDWKVDRHMEDLGQGRYRMSIEDSEPRNWIEGFARLLDERETAVRTIAVAVSRARGLVIAQFAEALP